jgi:hypothetical protein
VSNLNSKFPTSSEIKKLLSLGETEILLLHHNDTDGLSSAAILVRALERANFKVRRICLEKPYPSVLGNLVAESTSDKTLVMLADFGSGMLDFISNLSDEFKRRFIILDHHAVSGRMAERINVINPLVYGLKGEDCSASAVAYLFAKGLNEWNKDLAPIGALGALGDGFLKEGSLHGLNAQVWQDALEGGKVSQDFYFEDQHAKYSWQELVAALDSLGSVGYFRGGADIAVKGLADFDLYGMVELSKPYLKEFNEALKSALNEISIEESKHISWVRLGDRFNSFGVKTVGLFCQQLRDTKRVSPHKYIAGFQPIPAVIPGLGISAPNQIKVSMRVPAVLQDSIVRGEAPALTEILPAATHKLGGLVDACHPLAASTTIPVGDEANLIRLMDEHISRALKNQAVKN